VELVNKLQELNFLNSDLLHSIHGKEYITTEQLCREIQQTVVQSAGRISVVSHTHPLRRAYDRSSPARETWLIFPRLSPDAKPCGAS